MSRRGGTDPSRRVRALDRARRGGAGSLLVSSPPNVRYLSGFTGSNGWLLLRDDGGATLLTDGRYREQAAREAPDVEVVIVTAGLVAGVVALELRGPIGFESTHVSHATAAALCDAVDSIDWIPLHNPVEAVRVTKDANEVGAIRRALALAEDVLVDVVSSSAEDVTEGELAARIEYECRLRGAEGMAFETIVAGGAHGALPHARPRPTRLPRRESIVLDMGCVVDGYCSDITRCVTVEPLDDEWMELHAVVAEAQTAAVNAVASGVEARAVDAAAREVLAAAGLEAAFVHSVGHGVGLEIHEAPRLASTSDTVLEVGMVVTIEPGIYLPGRGGIRLEDMVLVTPDGGERLNRLDVAPLRLGEASEAHRGR